MIGIPDMRRRIPEPPAGAPEIQFKPGMADEVLREPTLLLAEEGIDVNNIDVPDLDRLQQALSRAVERHNMAMFTPAGQAREPAAVTMRLAAEAIAGGDTKLAAAILDQAPARISGRFRRHRHRLHRPRAGHARPLAIRATPAHQTGWPS